METSTFAQSESAQTWTVAGQQAGRYKGDGKPARFDVTKRGRQTVACYTGEEAL